MAEKKIKKAETPVASAQTKPAPEKGNATGYRIGAVAAWLFAIAFEVVAILIAVGKLNLTFMSSTAQLIIAIVLDLALVIVGSLLWKKSNRIDPASEKNKVKFWLWNNMGVIVTVLAFVPFIVIALTNKNTDKKTKTIAVAVAAIALIIGALVSYDWNPVSSEALQAAQNALGDTEVYWTQNGNSVHKYHIDPDCYHLKNAKSDTIYEGTVDQAFAGNATALCKTCQKNHQEIEGINNVDTGDGVKNVETEGVGIIDIDPDETLASTEAE